MCAPAITNCGQIPAIPNAEMRNIQKVYKPDERVQILCKEGFQAQVKNLTCQEGTWISYGLPLAEICTRESSLIQNRSMSFLTDISM